MIKTILGAIIGIPEDLKLKALEYFVFEKELINIIIKFEEKFLGVDIEYWNRWFWTRTT